MNDIKKLSVEIDARDETIAFEVDQENIILANLGQALHESGTADAGTVSGTLEEIRNLEDALRQILADDEKRTAITEEQKSLKVESRNLKNKESQLQEELARSAWDLWKSGRQVDVKMEEALDDLIKADERLNAAEDALYRNENDTGSKAANILSKGRALLLAGKKKNASAALDRLWGKAGSKIQDLVDLGKFADTPASTVAVTLKALNDRRVEIGGRESILTADIEVLDNDLEKMPGKGGVRKRISWIEDSLQTKRGELDYAFQDLGRDWLNSGNPGPVNKDVDLRRKEWIEINQRIEILDQERKAFQAHKSYLESMSERDAKARQAEKLDKEVKSRQTELKDLKKELSVIEKKMAALKEGLPPLPKED